MALYAIWENLFFISDYSFKKACLIKLIHFISLTSAYINDFSLYCIGKKSSYCNNLFALLFTFVSTQNLKWIMMICTNNKVYFVLRNDLSHYYLLLNFMKTALTESQSRNTLLFTLKECLLLLLLTEFPVCSQCFYQQPVHP